MQMIGCSQALLDVPPARVWAALADVAAWKTWMPGVGWAVLEGAFETGSYVTIKAPTGRRQTAWRIELAEPPHTLALGLTFGPVAALRRTWSLEANGAGTRVAYTVESSGPLRRLLTGGIAGALHRDAPALLEALSATCCSG